MKRILKSIALLSILACLLISTTLAHAGAPLFILYENLRGVFCAKGTSASDPTYGPYFAYFDVDIHSNYPPGSVMHATVIVNGTVTSDTWTWLPVGFSGVRVMERIDTNTPNYTASKRIELWYGGILRSKTEIEATCTDALTGRPAGPYGRIVAADVF